MMFDDYLSDPLIAKVSEVLEPLEIADDSHAPKREGQRPASVLMPLIPRENEMTVLLTKRPMHMPSHAGQISFPGGRTEAGEMPHDGALRETHEEVGIAPTDVHLLGRLPSFDAMSLFRVTPYVGIVNPKAQIIPDPGEVDEAFELPFSFLMNPNNHVERRIDMEGRMHILYDMPYPSQDETTYHVWGMTAMILYRLYERAFQ